MAQSIKLQIKIPNLDPYSTRQWNADVFCECCGRGISNRKTAYAVINEYNKANDTWTFKEVVWSELKGKDPVEWGGFVGSHCAKKLPATHKASMKKVIKNLIVY